MKNGPDRRVSTATKRWRRLASHLLAAAGIACLLLAVLSCSPPELRLPTITPNATIPPAPTATPALVVVVTPSPAPQATPTPAPTDTPTPVPTDTPTPPTDTSALLSDAPALPTATPAVDPVLIAEVTARALNMRAGPGMGYSRTGVVQQGYRMTVVGRNAEGTWLRVCCVDGEEGWLSAIYVDLSQEVGGVVISVDAPGPPATSTLRIVIPGLVIEAPVVEVGWQEVEVEGRRQMEWEVASFAAGHHSDSALPGQAGNVVISGHHNIDGRVFKNISLAWNDGDAELQDDGVTMRSNALDGQSVYIYDSAGEVFEYVVEGMYKMPDRHVSEAQRQRNARFIAPTTEPILTLITCWPYNSNTHRIVVVARMVQ